MKCIFNLSANFDFCFIVPALYTIFFVLIFILVGLSLHFQLIFTFINDFVNKGLKIYSIEAYILLMNRGNIVMQNTKKLFCVYVSVLFGGDHGNNVTIGWLGDQRLLTPSSVLGMSYTIGAVWRTQPWKRKVSCWDHLDCMCDWIQLRPLCKLWRFWLAGREIYSSSEPSRISLLCKLLCVLNPPPTSLGPSVSFFGPFLPSEYGAQFRISHGNSRGCKPTML